jgi:hypothetical protein
MPKTHPEDSRAVAVFSACPTLVWNGRCVTDLHSGPAFARGTTGAKRKVGGGPPPPIHKNLQQKNAKLCNIVTATSLLN